MLSTIILTLLAIHTAHGHVCFHCVSYAHFLSPTLRRQLGAQSDVFHWPIDASSPNCGAPSKADHEVQAHICTKHNLCVTLSPNTANVSFVVRGCLEQVLVTKLRIDNRLLHDGCYIVHSKPIYRGESSLDYVICVCSSDYCNNDTQSAYVELERPLSEDVVVELVEQDRIEPYDLAEARKLVPKSSNKPRSSSLLSAIIVLSIVYFLFA